MPAIESRLLVRPLYMQVRDLLVNHIVEGEWKPGTSLPNETALAQKLGISIGTVRKALDIMENERIVTRRQGRGTFVNDFATQPLLFSSFFSRENKLVIGERRGKCVLRISADETTAKKLGIAIGEAVILTERVRLHNGRPFLTEICKLPARLFPIVPEDLSTYRISLLAQHNAIIVGHGEELVTACAATASDAKDLDVPEGAPLLGLDRLIYSDRGDVLEWRVGRAATRNESFVVRYL